jgi:hypothetical protein
MVEIGKSNICLYFKLRSKKNEEERREGRKVR